MVPPMIPPMTSERSSTAPIWQPLIGVAAVLITIIFLIGTAQAVPIVTDGDMNTGNWQSAVLLDTTPGQDAQVTTSDSFTGGNPGSYIEVEHIYTGPGDMTVGHASFLGFYFPALDGALNALTYSFDVNFLNTPGTGGSPPGAVAFRAMLFQDNGAYQAGFQIATTATWTTLTFANLIASDFSLVSGSAPLTPDFSSVGAPMLFGFFSGNGSAFGGQNTVVFGVDNFSVSSVVAGLPGPASAMLLSLGLAVLVARKRT